MFQIFLEESIITAGILIFMVVSMISKVLLASLYQRMIRETDNMATTENRLLKQCKLKFENCYQLNNGVSNIPVFVEKFIGRLALGPISFESLYHFSGQSMLLSVTCAGIGICKRIMEGSRMGDILPFYVISFLGLYLYFSLANAVDVKGKREMLKVNLVDYLDNHLSARLRVTQRDLDMLYGGRNLVPLSEREYRRGRIGEPVPEREYRGGRMGEPLLEREYRGGQIGEPVLEREYRGGQMGEPVPEREYRGKRTVELMPIGRRDDAPRPAAEDIQVTDEELEALIKEFC